MIFMLDAFPSARCTNAVGASAVVLSNCAGVVPFGVPVKTGDSIGAFSASAFVIVVAKFGSFPSASANSFSVLSDSGA
ncbi:hypothetical protein WM34_29650 [Burkholderia ubonensis]|nr:hypothetical protein WJ74_30430 [Burkholderia ubonensis]KWD09693.1 hypothetical protein WL59_03610 [Burkholderia ubonensis]KWD13290.1 hypothetical protein WL60_17570 [Burkholderia ubonensis]KWD49778.1 hypothetical protein WL67_21345 [Burkholderia ubonensis]KWD60559.1 hypothetical protein WL66_05930 [Burkholderia ubonensis]